MKQSKNYLVCSRRCFPIFTTTEYHGFSLYTVQNEEIQILACYMKVEWLNRTILCWENVKPLYEERDFSQANLIGKFTELLRKEEAKVHRLEGVYYRAPKRKPFSYRLLAEQYQDV